MKILYIAPDITDSGGISRVISLKANYLVTHLNYDVRILSVNDCSSNRFYDFNPAIKWYNIEKSKNGFLFFRNYIHLIKKTISEENPDIIVICDAVLWLFIPWFVKTEIPVIFETHFSVSFKKSKNKSLYNRFRSKLVHFIKQKTINKFTCFVSITNEGNKEWEAKNAVVISNPLSFGIVKQAKLIHKKALAIGMNPYVKGIDRLLVVWKKIIQNYPDWILDIYGQWDINVEYKKMADALDISNNVNFLPATKDIQNSYNQSSVFLMTSRSEVFPMALLEAMSCGLPCIAYDCPSGPRAIIEEGINGFLIEDGNSDSFVQKLELLIEDENLRRQMGSNAQETVKKYDIDSVMKKWEQLFMELKK